MSIFEKLFGKNKVEADSNEIKDTGVDGFILSAMLGEAYCRVPISKLASTAEQLSGRLMKSGISSSDISDLFNNSLIAFCPKCGEYCSGGGILMLFTFSLVGNVLFTGNSGGAEHLMKGRCKNASCSSTEYELYWCPDLNKKMLMEIQKKYGISIDPNMQSKRPASWKQICKK